MEDLDPASKLPDDVAIAAREQDKLFGPYVLVRELGRGGVGIVYYGFDLRLRRRVAIKLLLDMNPDTYIRFEREARAAAKLEHPGIVRVLDLARVGTRPYIAMEFIEGKTLQEIFKEGSLGLEKLCAIIRDVSRAIGHAHAAGIVHRDVKPGNIIVDGDGRGKIMDFGVARDVESAGARLTTTGATLGTPKYMSPEQVADARMAAAPSDVYSLGAVLYEGLAGRPPFIGTSPVDVMFQIMKGAVERPSAHNRRVGRRLDAIVLQCLARDPLERFPNGEALAREIDAYLTAGESSFIRPPKDSDPGKQPASSGNAIAEPPPGSGSGGIRLGRRMGSSSKVAVPSRETREEPPDEDELAPHSRARLVIVVAAIGLVLGAGGGLAIRAVEQERRDAQVALCLDDAEDQVKKGKLAEALALVESALALSPDDERAQRLRREVKDAQEAARKEERAREEKKRKEKEIASLLERARAEQDLQKRLSLLDEALKLEPNDKNALLARATLKLRIYQAGQNGIGSIVASSLDELTRGAVSDLDHVLKLEPGCSEALLQRARARCWLDKTPDADRAQVEAAAAGKGSWAAYAHLYLESMERGSTLTSTRILELAKPIVASDPSFGRAWLDLASAYETMGEVQEALVAASRAVDLDVGYLARRIRARLRWGTRDYKGLEEDANALLAELPHDGTACEMHARSRLGQDDPRGALADAEKLFELKCPLQGYAIRAQAKSILGDVPGAIADYDQALARPELDAPLDSHGNGPVFGLDPNARAHLLALRARSKERAGQIASALEDATTAFALGIHDPELLAEVAVQRSRYMRAAEGDLEGARRLLESVHDKRHPNARVLVQLASCYIASGDLTDATDFLEQADKLTGGKRDGSAEKVAAAIERRKKLLAQKLEPLDIAVAQDPKDAQARAARAEVLLGAGQWEKARTDAEAAVENGSGRAKAIAYRILALAGPKPLSEILAGFDRAVEADPTFALALADRANFKAATRDKTAREDAERLAAMTAPDAVALSRASHAFLTLGDAEAASKLLARALEVDPRCVDALRTSAQLKAERGDRVGAAADLRAIVASDPDAADAQELENRAAFLERK